MRSTQSDEFRHPINRSQAVELFLYKFQDIYKNIARFETFNKCYFKTLIKLNIRSNVVP
jgi:hypothetical protein